MRHLIAGRARATPLALAVALLLGAVPAAAIEPTTVSVEGAVVITEANSGRIRDLAFRAALAEAVLQTARLFASPERLELDAERVEENIARRAASYVLTYTIDGPPFRRPSADDPELEEYVVAVTATVDATQLRAQLRSLGLLRSSRDRPSVALLIAPVGRPFPGAAVLLTAFERYLADRLEADDFVVVEPALRQAAPLQARSALDLARSLGADLALDLRVSWRQRALAEGVVGGVAEVTGRALRTHDGFELATTRFDAPAYHPSRDEAYVRALEALQDQLANNLLLQLNRNWFVLAQDDDPVFLTLADVSSYLQIEAVRSVLENTLGAQRVELIALAPRRAEILVELPLSAGALQDRLAKLSFEGFRLEPVEVRRDRIQLRVTLVEAIVETR